MSDPTDYRCDELARRRAFERAAAGHDAVAVLHAQVRERLLERLDMVRLTPRQILDLGAGTGSGSVALARRYPTARVIAVDGSQAMLQRAHRRRGWRRRFALVRADACALPLPDASVDLVFSNLMLAHCDDVSGVFRELRRVIAPHGLVTFTTVGPDTLGELRAAWAEADDLPHVQRFLDMHDVGDALVQAGLAEPVLDVERFVLTYQSVTELMRELKALGAYNVMRGRRRGLTGRARMQRMIASYERVRSAGRLPACCEVIYGHAWGPPAGPRRLRGSEVSIQAAHIRRRRRREPSPGRDSRTVAEKYR